MNNKTATVIAHPYLLWERKLQRRKWWQRLLLIRLPELWVATAGIITEPGPLQDGQIVLWVGQNWLVKTGKSENAFELRSCISIRNPIYWNPKEVEGSKVLILYYTVQDGS